MNRRLSSRIVPAACLAYFLTAGLLIIPYPGIQNDEALFAGGIYAPEAFAEKWRILGHTVPVMLMSYVGALKSWIYTPIFALWSPSVYSLRVPVLLIGALAVWLFFQYLDRIAGWRAALAGCALLATDVPFLLTATLDWGPVALKQVLILGGLLLAVRYYQERSEKLLAAAFFLFGLAVWDKAVFVWMFSGVAVATVLVFGRALKEAYTPRRGAIAAAAFLAGASPLIVYNVANGFPTFRDKRYSLKDLPRKITVLGRTVNGSVMGGFLVDYSLAGRPREPRNLVEAASVRLSDATGHRTSGLLPYVLLLGVLLIPLSQRAPEGRMMALPLTAKTPSPRTLLFFPVAFAVSWGQMLIMAEAGAGAHHTVLLAPHVVGFAAAALVAGLARVRRAAAPLCAAVVLMVAGGNVLVFNEHLAGLIRYGPTTFWTDATQPLAVSLRRLQPAIVYAADWGMGDTLRAYLGRKVPVANAIEPFTRRELDGAERQQILKRMSFPGALFVGYTEGREVFPIAKQLLAEQAAETGFRKELLEIVCDSRGRPTFEIYSFVKD